MAVKRRRWLLVESAASGPTPPGYLLYAKGGMLVAHPFNVTNRGRLRASQVIWDRSDPSYTFRLLVSRCQRRGVLAHRNHTRPEGEQRQLVSVNGRSGRWGEVAPPDSRAADQPLIVAGRSDGLRVDRLVEGQPGSDIWLVDVARGVTHQ